MLRFALAVTLAALLGMLGFFALKLAEHDARELGQAQYEPYAAMAMPVEHDGQSGVELPAAAARSSAAAGAQAAERKPLATGTLDETCTLIGRVLDLGGQPLPHASLTLSSQSPWPDAAMAPALGEKKFGWAFHTDSEGHFTLSVPIPTPEWLLLQVEFDALHSQEYRVFGPANLAPMLSGIRDIGDVALGACALISGQILDESGAPLADAIIDLQSNSQGYLKSSTSLRDGSFRVPHAPPGSYEILVELEGYLSQRVELPSIRAGTECSGITAVLQPAPTISGVIMDPTGHPVAAAQIRGRPAEMGSDGHAQTTSHSDGRFQLALTTDEPYDLKVECDGFRRWGNELMRENVHAPGTEDLRIVLERLPQHTFLVLDDVSGEPVDEFGVRVFKDNGAKAQQPIFTSVGGWPRIESHPGGRADIWTEVGRDQVLIYAAGYLPSRGEVEPLDQNLNAQVVRLHRGASIQGRVVDGMSHLTGIRIQLEYGGDRLGVGFRSSNVKTLFTTSDNGGRFGFSGLEEGDFRLTLEAPTGAPTLLEFKGLDLPEHRDLGDLQLSQGGRIMGRLSMPDGVSPEGLEVFLDGWQKNRLALADSAGRFHFEDIAAGAHFLELAGRPGELASGDALHFQLEPAESKHLDLDARELLVCQIEVKIELPGISSEGMEVTLTAEDVDNTWIELGPCDKHGWARGSARGWGMATLRASGNGMGRLRHPSVRLNLTPGGHVREVVRFEFSGLVLKLAEGMQLPADGEVRLRLIPNDLPQPVTSDPAEAFLIRWRRLELQQDRKLRFQEGVFMQPAPGFYRAEPGELYFGTLLPGHWDYVLTFNEAKHELAPKEHSGSVTLRPNETTLVEVR